jgi:antitoxin component of RelBE/YafQ-DinJ toxin-antitoxin module
LEGYIEEAERRGLVLISVRIPESTFSLLRHLSQSTGLTVSELVRRACVKFILEAPEELPLELKAKTVRVSVENIIETIRDIRFIYHKAQEAYSQLRTLKHERLPSHAVKAVEELEKAILERTTRFNQWLMEKAGEGGGKK